MLLQWLKDYKPVTFDFNLLQLFFVKDEKNVVLQGESDLVPPTVQLMSVGDFRRTLNSATHGYFRYIFGIHQDPNQGDSSVQNSGGKCDKKDQSIQCTLLNVRRVFRGVSRTQCLTPR